MKPTPGLRATGRLRLLTTVIFFSIAITTSFCQKDVVDSLKALVTKDPANPALLMQISHILRNTEPAEAKSFATSALRSARSKNVYGTIDSALYELAGVNYILGNLDTATIYLRERIEIEAVKKDSAALARSYSFLGGILNELGKKVESLEIYIKAKKISDRLPDTKLRYGITYNIALYYHDDIQKSLAYRLEAYDLSKQLTDYPQAYRRNAEITSVLGNEYVRLKDFNTARKFLREALVNAHLGNFPSREAFAYGAYSEIHRAEKNYDSAIYYLRKAIDLKTSIGEKNRLHDSIGLLGEVYMEKGDYDSAIRQLERAVEICRELKSSLFLYRWLPPLAKAYSMAGKNQLAYEALAEYQSLADSVMNEEKVKAIADLEAKYETEKKEREIESLKKQQLLEKEISQNKTIIFAGVIVLLAVAGLAWYFRAKAKEQENIRLTERIDSQNRELSTISLLVNKKNETLLGIKDKLNAVSKQNGDVKSIAKDIDREIEFDAEWDTFKYHFEKVHPGFFQKLAHTVPALTNKEQRYCAYFKSNLATKEIAQLTNTSVRGVQQARYRINQKFQEVNASLADFVNKA